MKNVVVNLINTSLTLPYPEYSTPGSDAMDLRACFDAKDSEGKYIPLKIYSKGEVITSFLDVNDTKILYPGDRVLVPTGIIPELPEGYRFHVSPRSGLSLKSGVTVLNTPGKIDSDYRENIGVILINLGHEPFTISHGDRIAQISLEESIRCTINPVSVVTKTERGSGGFGHTGVK